MQVMIPLLPLIMVYLAAAGLNRSWLPTGSQGSDQS